MVSLELVPVGLHGNVYSPTKFKSALGMQLTFLNFLYQSRRLQCRLSYYYQLIVQIGNERLGRYQLRAYAQSGLVGLQDLPCKPLK